MPSLFFYDLVLQQYVPRIAFKRRLIVNQFVITVVIIKDCLNTTAYLNLYYACQEQEKCVKQNKKITWRVIGKSQIIQNDCLGISCIN